MERRERQIPTPNPSSQPDRRVGKAENESEFEFQLRTNRWLRIGLTAKDTEVRFTNLFSHINMETLRSAFQAMDSSKATGIDGRTKSEYGRELDKNLWDLVTRLHKGTYRPQPRRRVLIPKADGKMRPIAISCFEDKLVEWVLAKLLTTVYEPMFIRHSYGFRPAKSAHDAIKVTYSSLKDNERPFVVEIDFASFFDTVSHRKLMKLIAKRIQDPRLRSLVARFLKAGILDEAALMVPDSGTAQGAIVSPVLANVYLHYALDSWFQKNYVPKGVMIRYADDAVFLFEKEQDSDNFKRELKTRMEQFKLTLNEEKSGKLHFHKRRENVFHFLGFTFYWGKDRGTEVRRLRVKTETKRLYKKAQAFELWVKEARSRFALEEIWKRAKARLNGHNHYFGVMTNRASLWHFYSMAIKALFKWLNRRSQRASFTWQSFNHFLIRHPLPLPPPMAKLKPLTNRRYYAAI